MASAKAEPCHQPRTRIGLQPPAPFFQFRKSTSAAEAGFQAGFNGTATLALKPCPFKTSGNQETRQLNLDSLAACCVSTCRRRHFKESARFCRSCPASLLLRAPLRRRLGEILSLLLDGPRHSRAQRQEPHKHELDLHRTN